jgi:hypothetical protein
LRSFLNSRRRSAVILAVVVVIVVLVALVFGASGGSSSDPSFKIVGGPCAAVANGGVVYSSSSGFTPNGKYVTQAWVNGRPIPSSDLHNPGRADVYGRTSSWHWTCLPPAGDYTVRITDLSTGKSAQSHFTIDRYAK